ncbi:MAG TPA: periplasmic heavy metal sensor [Methylomirabilota bacterium]|nr:periplasmic heavy metal sensor [Methylomirabilota bacterium]
MKRLVLFTVLLAASATVVASDFNLPPGKWWENERVAAKIGLSDDQQRAIGDLVYRHAHAMIDLNAALKKAELELSAEVDRNAFDADGVRKAFGRFQTARRALENERFEMLLAVRATLSTEQWRELLAMRRQLEQLRERRFPGDGPERPRPPRPGGR